MSLAAITPTGFVTERGVLHIFEDPDDLRAFLRRNQRDFSMCAWIEGLVIHVKGDQDGERNGGGSGPRQEG